MVEYHARGNSAASIWCLSDIFVQLSTVDPSLAENSVIEGDSKPVVISPPPSKRDNPRKQIGDLQNGLPSPEALMELLESFFKPDLPLQPSARKFMLLLVGDSRKLTLILY